MTDGKNSTKDNVIVFPSEPKTILEKSADGKNNIMTIQEPGQLEQTYKIDIEISEDIMDYFHIKYRNILGKIVSVIGRAHEGYNYYVDYDFAVIIEFYKKEHHFIAKQLLPLHFINEDGFTVHDMSEKNRFEED